MARRVRSRTEMRSLIGDPKRVAKELRTFRNSTRALSSEHPRLISKYRGRWVAVHEGKVKAEAPTFDSLMAAVDQQRLPREHIVVRYIEKDERIMIL